MGETTMLEDQNAVRVKLQERIKELECLYEISAIISKPDFIFDEILQGITDRIPSAFRKPEHTCVRISIGSKAAQTLNYESSPWKLNTDIRSDGKAVGVLEVGYIGSWPRDKSPFLDEEKKLLKVIAAHLGLEIHKSILKDTLKQSEKRYRTLADNAPIGIVQRDLRGELLYANGAALEMFGYRTLEEARMFVQPSSHYRDPEIRKTMIDMLTQTSRLTNFEVECITKTGDPLFILFSAGLEGDIITGMLMNITEHKRIVESLRKNEKVFEKAQQIAQVGSWEWDMETDMLHCSNEAYRILGMTPQESHVTFDTFLAMVHLDDRQKVRNAIDELIANDRKEEGLEIRIIRKNGAERSVLLRGQAVFASNRKPKSMIGAVLDITERKQAEEALLKSEERLTEAQRIGHVGSWDWDVMNGDLYWSDETFRIFGLVPQEFPATYEAFLGRIYPKDRPAVEEAVNKSMRDPNTPYSVEHRIVLPDGSVRTVQECGEVTFDAYDGKPIRMIGSVHDVSEHKRAENEIKRLKDRLEAENIYLKDEIEAKEGYGDIIGVSETIQSTIHKCRQVARMKTTVLLTGETGTGKGIFARYVHQESDRKNKPFVNVNCAGLPANLIESELFGREKGAFTGSTARQIGRFELANGGTIFLDEIGELPVELQSKLLKVIEEGEFERLGSPKTVKVDVRIIASTNRNLEEEMKKGRFRLDLYYRLSVFPISIPPLRERKGDVSLLAKNFMEKFSRKYKKDIKQLPARIIEAFEKYHWPGNVRELINVIDRAVIVSDGSELQFAETMEAPSREAGQTQSAVGPHDASYIRYQTEVTLKEQILSALSRTGWRVEGPHGAAAILGINPSTLRTRMKKLGIVRPGSPT